MSVVNPNNTKSMLLDAATTPVHSKPIGSFYTLEPHNVQLPEPVEISIPYDEKIPQERYHFYFDAEMGGGDLR